ncbi:DUF4347 domain-containing protein [Roseimaritima ulvae]|uniref:Cadherin domain-containing protein n=1 Tax=Roseimaritima ulvae TaxID=980254 RepID=A0A5B9QMD9_9BACT|nr:DUF4347 domain-containing protein [Roseimaritima ulvae]QEG40277.1 hypothetical protein UC8_22840 [Roseimaritima ulvae]
MAKQQPKRVFDFYPLEDRVLLSGTGAEGLEGLDPAGDVDVDLADALLAQLAEAEGTVTDQPQAGEPLQDPSANDEASQDDSEEQASDEDAQDAVNSPFAFDDSRPLEVIFVDAGVEDADVLLGGLRADGDAQTQWLVIEISADEDGVERISNTLDQLSGVDAVHLLSHGDGQGIQLGNSRLDLDTAAGYAGQIAGWQGALDADSDLLIYGCDLASTAEGRELIDSIASLSDCDVAASDDVTGHQTLGGDWDLEYSRGTIEAEMAFSYDAIDSWEHTLAPGYVTTTFQDGVDSYSGTVDTFLSSSAKTSDYSARTDLEVDSDGSGDPMQQTLIRFDDLFGTNPGQMPQNVYITSASLSVNVTNSSSSGAHIGLYAMQTAWADTSTWDSMSDGVSTNDAEAAATADASVTDPTAGGWVTIDGLEDRVQSWQDRASSNYGWVIESDNTDGWDIGSSESGSAPQLSVTYISAGSQASTAHTLVVDTANDVLDGDATSIDALLADKGADGKISLREAIWAANNTTNFDASTPDQIEFAIGTGGQTIMVGAGGLPTLTDAVVLDATTQPGYAGTPLITLDGTNATSATGGITLRTSNSTVSGFIVQNFVDEGLEIDGSTGFGDNNILENNWVGVTSTGAAAGNGDNGILVTVNAYDNIIRNNVVGDSGGHGIQLKNDAVGNWVYGNNVGIGIDDVTVRANGGHGIDIRGSSTDNIIGTDRDNVADVTERNVISGNTLNGIDIDATSSGTEIAGNWIGTTGTGSSGVGNSNTGINVLGANTIIGGSGTDHGNVITGNANEGINISGTSATGTIIQGNIIGLDADGATGSGNADVGIAILAGAHTTTIGGSLAGQGNVISKNYEGIEINSNNNTVQGNFIGTDITGTLDRGNRSDDGVEIQNNATGNLIGGTVDGAGNVIAFNALDGVNVVSGTGNQILGNSIFSNTGLAIDLGNNGVTANDGQFDDTPDQDNGANNLQNFPVLAAAYAGPTPTITGTIKTTPSRTFRIEFYANATGDASGYGEGQRYLGFVNVTTNPIGEATIAATLSSTVVTGEQISATATDLTTNETSEFGLNVTATNSAPVLDATQSPVLDSQTEDDGAPSGAVGTLVSSLVDFASPAGQVDNVTDSNPTPSLGIAITAANTTNGTWYYSTDAGSNWNALGAVSDANARLLAADANTRIYFHSDANYNGTIADAITFRAWDQTTGSNGGVADTSNSIDTYLDTFSSVSYSNSNGATAWTTNWIETDNDGAGASGGNISVSGNALQVAPNDEGNSIYREIDLSDASSATLSFDYYSNLPSGNPDIQVRVSGNGGTNYVTLASFTSSTNGQSGTLSYDISSYLSSNTRIQFYVNSNAGGSTYVTFDDVQVVASDQNAGGSTAFSTATDTAGLTVTAVNDAPVMAPLTPTYAAVEDGASYANTVAAFLGSTVTDVDAGAVEGAAVTALTGDGARIDYSLDGGVTWLQFDALSESNALLLRATDRLRFTPATDNGGSISIAYRAWDQTTGTAGNTADTTSNGGSTAFSAASDSITVNTTSVNDAPIAVDDHHGLTFDGVDDFVNLGSDASLEFTSTMTMEVWARPTAYPASSSVILNKEGEYEIGISDTGSLMWAFSNTDPAWNWHDTGHVLQLNEWAHISVSYDNGTVNTYVNGHIIETYDGSGNIGDAHVALDDFRVGGRQNNPAGNYFTGDIDEVRLWSTARTQSEIQNNLDVPLVGNETGLAGYWNFNEGSGTTANDLSSNANHGVLTDGAGTGTPIWTGFATDQNTALNIASGTGVLQNDVDIEGDTLTVSHVQGSAANVGNSIVIGSGALVTLNANGSFNYDPNGAFDQLAAGETATDSFTYTVSDGNGGSDTATVSVTITGTDDAPTIVADSDLDDPANEVIDFQGGDDTISLTGLPVNTADGTDVTVEFWMNWDGTDNVMPFGFGSYDLWLSGGNIGFNTGSGDLYGTSSAGLAAGWHHVTAIFHNGDATGSRLIIDGVEQTMTQKTNSPNNSNANASSNAQISGWTSNTSYKFGGQIDQVRIWNGGRSETQVRADMFTELSGPQTGLVASYSFTGATTAADGVIDDSGNGHHGTISGMTAANVIAGSGFDALGDQTVNEDDLVTLQVSAFDPENAALTYTWTQTSGPAVTLSDANAEKPTFTALNQTADYQLVFTVDASDGSQTTTETVTISVNAVNDAPSGADNTLTTLEDTDLTFTAADFGFTDSGENNDLNAVRITTQTAAGSVYVDADGDGVIDAGETVVAGAYVDVADINAGRLKYKPVADANGSGYAQFTFQVQDDGGTAGGGQDTDPSANTMVIDVTAVNDAPVITGGPGTAAVTETDAGLTASGTLTVTDVDTADVVTAAVDSVVVSGTGSSSVPGSLTNGTLQGFLSVSPTAILDGTESTNTLTWNFNSGGEAFDFLASGETLVLTYTVSATDDAGTPLSDTETVTVTITGTNDAAVVDLNGADAGGTNYTTSFNEGDSAVSIADVDATISDSDNTEYDRFTVTLTGFADGNKEQIGIAGRRFDYTAPATHVETVGATNFEISFSGSQFIITKDGGGTMPQADLQTLLRSMTFENLDKDPTLGARTITFVARDSNGLDSAIATTTINTGAINDAPVITGGPGTAAVTETDAGLTASGTLTVTDVDTADVVTAGVDSVVVSGTGSSSVPGSLTNGTLQGFLSVSPTAILDGTESTNTLTWNFNSGGEAFDFLASGETLVLTYTVSATDDAGTPLSDTETVTVTITGTNDAAVETSIEGTAVDYTENDGAVAITSTIAFSDVDDTHIESAVVQITGNYAAGEDVLTFVDQNGITGTWNNGTLTLTGSATLAQYETAIRSITYQNTSDDPSALTRTISFTVSDGDVDSNTLTRDIDFTATNDDPTNAGSLPSDIAVTEDVASNVDLSAIDLSDVDHGGSDLTVTLTTSTGGNLSASDSGGVTVGGSGTGTVTLTGTQDELNTFLNTASNVQYLHSTANLNGNDADTIQVQVTDNGNTGSGGGGQIALGTVNVDISAVNDAPVNTVPGTQTVAEETTTAINGVSIGDVDAAAGNLTTRLQVSNGVVNVTLSGAATISAGSNGTGDLTIQGSVADINATLASLTYTGDTNVNGVAADTLTVTTNDGGNTGSGGALQDVDTVQIDITGSNDAPVASSIEGTAIDYTENDGAVTITSTIAFSDVDDTHIESAVIEITGNYAAGEDVLTFVDQNGITGTWNNGTLTLTGSATLAQYETAIRSITYENTSDDPSALTRTISFTVNDGDVDSNTLTRDIDFTATNDDPTNAGSLPSDITVTEDLSSNVDLSAIDLSDVDHQGSDLTVTLTTSTGGNLSASDGGGVTVGGSGTGTVTLTGTQDELNTFLNTASNVQYLHSTTNLNGNDADTIQLQVTDNGNTGSGGGGQIDLGTVNVDISAVNDAPVNTVPGTQTVAEETPTAINGVSIGDVDAATGNLTTRLQVSNGVVNVTLSGAATISSGTNGTGDLTIQGSVADINATLASLTYTGDTDVVGTAADTLTVTTNDGGNTGSGGALQDVDTVQIDITTVNDAPVASSVEGTAIDYTENDGAVAITSTIAFSDVDDTHIDSAVVEISGNYAAGEDVLTFIDQNGITGTWNNGTLTLIGSATLAQYETAIRSITYENTSDDPSALTRTISFTVNDGDVDSNTLTRDIDFTATNDDPTNAGSLPSDITVTEDLSSNVDLSAIDLSDVDHQGSDLTVTLTTSTGGNLSASDGGGVTVGGSGTGTVTLTGTQDELNTFLNTASNVQYLHSTANLNGNDADTIQLQVTDNGNTGSGGGGQIDLGTVNVDISAVNDAPVNTVPGTQTVAEETPTAINGVSIGDVDAAAGNLTTRLQVSNGVLNVTLFGAATISAGSDGSGDLTIQGSVSDINATLTTLTYTGDTDVVGTAADTLTVTTNDGGNTGSGGALQDVDTIQIDISTINDAPVASSIEGTAIDYTENDGAVPITSTIAFSDVDDTHIESALVQITGNYAAGEDVLTFVDQNGITGTWNNGTLTLTGSATLAQYETAIRSITYENTSDDPSALTRTISFTVNDGDVDSNTLTRDIDFTATNDDPTNAGSLPSDITVTEDVASNVDLSAIDLSDVDHQGSDLTITLTTSTGGNLSASDGGGVTVGGSGTGTVTLTGTQDELNTFLNTASNVQYLHSTANLNGNDADTIQVQVTDNGNTGSGGGGQIDLGTVNVDISAVNDAPVNTVPGTQTVAEETPTAINGVSIGDVDAATGNLTTRLQVSNGVVNVTLSGAATISSGTNGTGDLTIQGSVADINATLASLTYTGDTNVNGVAADTLTVTTNDGGNTGSGGALQDVDTVQIDITTVNDAPVASSIEGTAVDYTENDGAVAITSTIAFSDVDDTHIESAVIQITGNYAAGEDVLTFVDQNGITGTWNNGTLTLTGSATLAQYETAIRSITYQNTSDDPSALTRTISFTVNDGDVDSNTLTRDIDFTATNDDPTNAGSLPSDITVTEDVASNVDLSAIDLSDVDHQGSDLTITLTTSTGGNLSASDGGGVTVGGSGTGTVTLTGTQDELNTFLNTASNVQYLHSTTNLNGNDADTIQVQVTDNGNTGSGGGGQIDLGTVNVDISAVNDAPVNTVPGTQTVAEETTTAVNGVSIGDVDAAAGNLTTRLQVSNGVLNVTLFGAATISAGSDGSGDLTIQGSVSDINATLTTLTYTGDTDVVGTAADTLTVTTNDGGNTGSGGALQDVDTVQIDITTVNDAPVTSSIEGTAIDYTENDGAVTITSTIAFSDVDDTHIESAVIEISGNYAAGEDVLTFVDQNGITGTWNNGTLTLTGSATLAQYETAIRSITYENTSDDPSALTRTISFTVNDGDVDSNTLTRDIDFTATNDDPTNAGSLPSDITVTEDVASNVDLSAIDLSDVDHQGSELTITLTTSTGGNLSASDGGGVTVGGSGTGTVTLTGTQDELNTFLNTASNVQYLHSTANLNGNDADTIQVQVTDNGNTGSGGGGQIDLGTVNVDISAVNDAPINTVPGTRTVAEETPTAINGVSIGDVDAAAGNLTTRLQVSNGVLNVTLFGAATISAGSDGSGDLTIQGSVSDINATLTTLTYTGAPDVVGVAADTLTVTTDDGGNTGSGGVLQDVDTVQIDITAINDAPVTSSIEGTAIDYTENDGAVAVTSTIAFSDVDDTHIESAVVEISGNYAAGEDVLTFVDQNGITGTWNNGTLTLIGSATLAQYETAIRSITYENTSDDPSALTRTISFTVNDGDVDSNTLTRDIDFTATNDDPTNAGSLPSDISVTEDVASNVDLSAIDLSDVDHQGSDLTVTLTTSTGGNLSASDGGGVTVGGSGTGTVTLTGTQDELNTFLNTASNVQYLHSTTNLNGNDADTIQVQVTDNGNTGSGGGGQIDLGTVNVDISAVNDAPVNTVPGTQTVAEETPTAINGVSIGDVDAAAGNLTTRLQVSNGVLNVTLFGAATISAGSDGSGDLTIQGSVSDINATLTTLTYTGDTDVVGTAADTLTVTTNDGGNTGSGGALQDVDTVQIDITTVNDAPVASSIEGTAVDYTENDGAVAITSTIAFSDVDDTHIDSAVVEISGNYAAGEDVLTFVDQNGITGTWNNGTLTLIGSATLAQYETAIRSITYENTSDDPSALTRTISFTVNDGDVDSNTLTRDIDFTATNDDPTNAGSLPSDIAVTEDLSSNVDLSPIDLSDVDHQGSDLTVTLTTSTGGNLSASDGGGVTVGGSGTGTVTLTGTQDELNTFLNTASNVQYLHSTANLNGNDADTIQVQVTDNGNTGSGGGGGGQIDLGTVNVDIGAVNDAPVNTVPGTQTVAEETTTAIGGVSIGDLDAATGTLTTRLQVNNGVINVSLSGAATISSGTNGTDDLTIQGSVTDINATLASLTYAGNTDVVGTAADTLTVTTGDGGNTGSGGVLQDVDTVQIDITAINDAPVASSIEGTAIDYTENDGPVELTSTIAFSDVDDTNIESAVVTITSNFAAGEDVLTFVDQNGITGTWNNGTLTLTGSATLAEYETAIRSITYENTSDDPSAATRTISFTVNDGGVDSNTLTRDIDFTVVNDSPYLDHNLGAAVLEGGQVVIDDSMLDVGDVDDSNLELTFTVVTSPAHGHLAMAGSPSTPVTQFTQDDLDQGQVIYVHDGSESTTDSFNFSLADGGEDSAATIDRTFQIRITPVNESPTSLNPTTFTIDETTDTSGGVALGTLTTIDPDAGDTFTYAIVGGSDAAVFSIGGSGNDQLVMDDGYLPVGGQTVYDVIVRTTDSGGLFIEQAVTVLVNDINQAPVAGDDTFDTLIGEALVLDADDLLANDTDADGHALFVQIVSQPAHGTISVDANGDLVYTPNQGYFGADQFSYAAHDGIVAGNPATVSIDVEVYVASGASSNVVVSDPGGNTDGQQSAPESPPDNTSQSDTGNGSPSAPGPIGSGAIPAGVAPEAVTRARSLETNEPFSEQERDSGSRPQRELGGVSLEDRDEESNQGRILAGASVTPTRLPLSALQIQQFEQILQQDIAQAIVWHRWEELLQEDQQEATAIVIGSVGVTAGLVSLGYVAWILRGGAFFAASLSSLPAWRMLDPATFLDAYRRRGSQNDDAERIFDDKQ